MRKKILFIVIAFVVFCTTCDTSSAESNSHIVSTEQESNEDTGRPQETQQRLPKLVEPMPVPVVPAPAQETSASIQEDPPEDSEKSLREKRLQGNIQQPVLQGFAVLDAGKSSLEEELDSQDQELRIEWDKWRNRFLRAVQLGVEENVNNPDISELEPPSFDPVTGSPLPRFPLGTVAWFSCQITAGREIKNLRIIKESGFASYDKAVYRAVKELAGSLILKYPKRSRRTVVTQAAGIRTANSNEFRYYNFGDVERRIIPGQ